MHGLGRYAGESAARDLGFEAPRVLDVVNRITERALCAGVGEELPAMGGLVASLDEDFRASVARRATMSG